MADTVLKETTDKMEKALVALQNTVAKLRTGRASLAVLDGIKVEYYGTLSPLNQVAKLAVPEPRLITIQPWEGHLIPQIEKAIEKANIGLNPASDGKIIRLPIPQLTEERRKDIVKQLKTVGEEARVAMRQARKEAMDALKHMEKDKKLSEDDLKRNSERVQKLTDDYSAKVEKIIANKEKDIMTL